MRLEYLAARMAKALRRLRITAHAAGGALALLLAVAVFSGAAQAGQRYVYCLAMREVMSHACCEGRESSFTTNTQTLAAVAPECCQARSMPALGVWTQAARAAQLSAP